jgi:hypothetical protein
MAMCLCADYGVTVVDMTILKTMRKIGLRHGIRYELDHGYN